MLPIYIIEDLPVAIAFSLSVLCVSLVVAVLCYCLYLDNTVFALDGRVVDGGSILQSALSRYKNSFNVGHINCSSINPVTQQAKLDVIRSTMRHQLLTVLAVSETWLHGKSGSKGSSDSSVAVNGYKIFRNDRITRTTGGGVALYVKKGLPVKIVAGSDNTDIEYLFAEVTVGVIKVLVGVIYRHPRCIDEISSLEGVLSTLASLYPNIVLVGDFNYNLLNPLLELSVSGFFRDFDLRVIHNNSPTHFNIYVDDTLLDYFVINSKIKLNLSSQFWFPTVSHHALIFVSLDLHCEVNPVSFEYRDYKSIDAAALLLDAEQISSDAIFASSNIDSQLHLFNTAVQNLYAKHVPIRTFKQKSTCNLPPWYTPLVRHSLQLKNAAFSAWRNSKNAEN